MLALADRLAPDDVLYWFDGPCIFTLRDYEGELYLAYLAEPGDAVCSYLVAPATLATVSKLKDETLPVRAALANRRLWIVETDHNLRVLSVATARDLQEEWLPGLDVCLTAPHGS